MDDRTGSSLQTDLGHKMAGKADEPLAFDQYNVCNLDLMYGVHIMLQKPTIETYHIRYVHSCDIMELLVWEYHLKISEFFLILVPTTSVS